MRLRDRLTDRQTETDRLTETDRQTDRQTGTDRQNRRERGVGGWGGGRENLSSETLFTRIVVWVQSNLSLLTRPSEGTDQ